MQTGIRLPLPVAPDLAMTLRLPRLVATSVVRGTHRDKSEGGVFVIDFEERSVEQRFDWNSGEMDFEGASGDRGLRGIAPSEEDRLIAGSDCVRYAGRDGSSLAFRATAYDEAEIEFGAKEDTGDLRQGFARGLCVVGERFVALLERKQLTAGSTWHAAGGFHAMNSDPNVARLQAYGISVYREVEEISGQDVGMHVTGGIQVAATDERWENIKYEHAKHRVLGIDSHLLTPDEIRKLCPIMDTTGVIGGLLDGNEGHIDPYGSTQALAKAARLGGAEIHLNTMVKDLVHKPDGTWTVVTDHGNIHCEHIVNAAGLWAREVGAMAGVQVPIVPMEHHYLLTEALDELVGWDGELPLVLDLDGEMYLRQEHDGVLLGVYERNSTPWSVKGTAWDFGETDLLEVRLDDIAEAQVARVSFTGELGYEIYVPATFAGGVYDRLMEAGRGFDIRPFGNRALVSMGMEKSFGVWSREFTPDYTPVMCGLDRWIDYGKADAWGYVKTRFLKAAASEFTVHLVDGPRPARLLPEPPYDPTASKMRA